MVISIIALLIAILLPALRAARYRARVISCLSNQRQLGLSLQLYANDFDDRLPPPDYRTPNVIYDSSYPGVTPDAVDYLISTLQGSTQAFFCPLNSSLRPNPDTVNNKYAPYFHTLVSGGHVTLESSYNLFFVLGDNPRSATPTFDWTCSGNTASKDLKPYRMGPSGTTLAADANVTYQASGLGDGWEHPYLMGHAGNTLNPDPDKFDTNALYADGHAATDARLTRYVTRLASTAYYPY